MELKFNGRWVPPVITSQYELNLFDATGFMVIFARGKKADALTIINKFITCTCWQTKSVIVVDSLLVFLNAILEILYFD